MTDIAQSEYNKILNIVSTKSEQELIKVEVLKAQNNKTRALEILNRVINSNPCYIKGLMTKGIF